MRRSVAVAETAANSLFERIGGHARIEHLVERFYERLWSDETLAPWFSGLDASVFNAAQQAFLIEALGGSVASDMACAAELRLELIALLQVTQHFHDTVMTLGLGEETAHELLLAVMAHALRG